MRGVFVVAPLAIFFALPVQGKGSESVFSASLLQLSQGASALQRGEAVVGIRSTEAGLTKALPPREAAAAHSNLCAGFVLLEQFDEALAHCDRAEGLDPSNWRIYNNRAAALLGKGLVEDAIIEIRRGLAIRPEASKLIRSLEIAREHKHRATSDPSSWGQGI